MSDLLRQTLLKRRMTNEDKGDQRKKLDKSVHLSRICDEFGADEIDADDDAAKKKEKSLENLRKEIVQWKKLLDESKAFHTPDYAHNVAVNYENIVTAEQLQYIRSAVDYEQWLTESNNFRRRIEYYFSKQKYADALHDDLEEEILSRIESVAISDYVDNFAFTHCPM